MGKGKLILLLYIPILTIGSWKYFESDAMVSLILFNREWKEYPEYYAFDTTFLMSISVLSYVIWKQAKDIYGIEVIKLTKFCFILSLIRIADYWLFHDLFQASTYWLISILGLIAILTRSDEWLMQKYGKITTFFKTVFDRTA